MSRRVAVRGLIAITARETFERVGLLGLAAALAVVPFLAPRAGIGDRPLLGAFLGSVMVFTAAVLTGSSVIARDLAERRIGFFLARPLPWWSIWGGKALATLVLTFTTGAIVLGPAAASGDWRFPAAGWWTAILVPGLLALIGGAHALAVAYRGRSGWFAADLAITVTLGWIVAGTYRALLRSGVDAYNVDYASAALWVVALAVTLASAAQVARGGTDIRRAHRILSLVIWSILVPAVLGYATWGAWVRRPSPADLASIVSAQAAPGTTWITVAGRVHWPRPASLMTTMMVDPRTGRFLRVAAATSTRGPVFLDGTHAVWIADAWSDTPRLFVADLGSNHPAATRMPLPIPPGPVYGLALSPDKRNVAVVQAERSTVFAIGSEQPLVVAPARLPGLRQAPFFSADGRAHVLVGPNDRTGPGVLDVLVLDPTSRRSTVTGHVPTRGNAIECWGPGAERVAIVQRLDLRPSVTLHDGTTGALLATLVPEGSAVRASVTFLRDGRVAVVEAGRETRLRVFTRDGAEAVSVPVVAGFALERAVEVAPDVVAVELPYQGPRAESNSALVDLAAARVVRVERGLRPAPPGWFMRDTSGTADPANLFINERGALVRLDIASGERHVVLGGE